MNITDFEQYHIAKLIDEHALLQHLVVGSQQGGQHDALLSLEITQLSKNYVKT